MLAALLALAPKKSVHADDSLTLLNSPIEFTDVIDAAEPGDPFDFDITLGFRHVYTRGTIERETTTAASGLSGNPSTFAGAATFTHHKSIVDAGIDIGLYHDLALYARLPVVVRDSRRLSNGDDFVLGVLDPDGRGRIPLFGVPFRSPIRFGPEHLAVGISWGILGQERRPDLPNWVIAAEGRFGIGRILEPCDADLAVECGQGVSRGTHALRVETKLSRRFRYFEPYGGLLFHSEWPGRAKDRFQPGGNLEGSDVTNPPKRGTFRAGAAWIPWENREAWQRVAVDVGFRATYVSEGRDYTPLFDALGTSASPFLRNVNFEGISPAGGFRSVAFTGLTQVNPHGRLGGRLALEIQASRRVRLHVGTLITYVTPHLITAGNPCNVGAVAGASDARAGQCPEGIVNPQYRPVVDLPGNRFRIRGAIELEPYATLRLQL